MGLTPQSVMTCILEKKRKRISQVAADDQFLSRFNILSFVGQGAHGTVSSAIDLVTKDKVAIKKLSKTFQNLILAKRTLRELKFLRLLRHENIISLRGVVTPAKATFNEVHVVTELLDTDLSAIIRSPQHLSDDHCRFLMYQLLRGVDYMHTRGVLHRDLKPKNIVVNRNCELKICDLGLARCDMPELQNRVACMTDYVATRWYRSPEVILGWNRYTSALDMWSVGCVLAELLLRKPLLQGRDASHQLKLIVELLGTRPEAELQRIRSEEARQFMRSLPRFAGVQWESLLPGVHPDATDLLRRLMAFDPEKRITAREALSHPYFHTLHQKLKDRGPKDVDLVPVPRDEFGFELAVLSESDLRQLVHEEILRHEQLGSVCAQGSVDVTTGSQDKTPTPPPLPPLPATVRSHRPPRGPIAASFLPVPKDAVSIPWPGLATSLESFSVPAESLQAPPAALRSSSSILDVLNPRSNSNSANLNSYSNLKSVWKLPLPAPQRDSVPGGCPCLICIAKTDPMLCTSVPLDVSTTSHLSSRLSQDLRRSSKKHTQAQSVAHHEDETAQTSLPPGQGHMSNMPSSPRILYRNSTPTPSSSSNPHSRSHPSSLSSTTTTTTTIFSPHLPSVPAVHSYPAIPSNLPSASAPEGASQSEHLFCSPSLARFLRDSAMCTTMSSTHPQLPTPSPPGQDRQDAYSQPPSAPQATAHPRAGPSSTSSSCATRLGPTTIRTSSVASFGVGAGVRSNVSSPARVPSYVLTSPPSSGWGRNPSPIHCDLPARASSKRSTGPQLPADKLSSLEPEVRARKRICY